MKLKEKLDVIKKDIRISKKAINLIRSLAPKFILHTLLYWLHFPISTFVKTYLAAEIINEVTGGRDKERMAIMVVIMVIAEFLFVIASKYSWRKINTNCIVLQQREEMYLNEKSFSMDYKLIESSKIREMRQAITEQNGVFERFTDALTRIFQMVGHFAASLLLILDVFINKSENELSGVMYLANTWWSALLLVALVALSCVVSIKNSKKATEYNYKSHKNLSETKKLYSYYMHDYLADIKSCKDVHIYNQKELINDTSEKIHFNVLSILRKKAEFQNKQNNKSNVVQKAVDGFVYAFVALKTVSGAIGIGSFLKCINGFIHLKQSLEIMGAAFVGWHESIRYVEDFFEYADIPNEMYYGKIPTEKRSDNRYDIEFHNVSFKYPGSEEYAVKNLNISFRVGDKVAVVGMNGSGKTTMIKLLCRLYDPTEGYITLNGIDIKKYKYNDYLDLFSVVFQDFKLFAFSVGENVAASIDYNEDKVWSSLEKAGMLERVKAMPKGLETSVYKDFEEDGVEISGGEAQKIAIARAIYKDAAFVVLDEPTASLDPIAEHEIYSRFNDMVKDKTAVYISHRLASCRFCDRILVFNDGQLIQDGSHEKLLEDVNGKYSELWNAQAQHYKEAKGA